MSLRKSYKALVMWEQLRKEYDTFWEYATKELQPILIDGGERAYEVFERLSIANTWTYFWNGNVYICFPMTETALLKGLRHQKKLQNMTEAEIAILMSRETEQTEVVAWHADIKPVQFDADLTI